MISRTLLVLGAMAVGSVALASDAAESPAPSTQQRDREAAIDRMRQRLDLWRSRLQRLPPRPPVLHFNVPSPALPRRPDAMDRYFGRDPMPGWTPPPGSVPWDYNGVRYWVVPLGEPRERS